MKSAASRLRAALAAVLVQAEAPELALVHRWLDNWRGVGLLAVGLHRIGYDLDLRQYGDGHWRATFYVTGIAHSILGGSAWEPTVWRAVQRAGWDALKHAERNLKLKWMLLSLLNSLKQPVERLVHAVIAQELVGRADCLELGQGGAEFGLAHRALPREDRRWAPS